MLFTAEDLDLIGDLQKQVDVGENAGEVARQLLDLLGRLTTELSAAGGEIWAEPAEGLDHIRVGEEDA